MSSSYQAPLPQFAQGSAAPASVNLSAASILPKLEELLVQIFQEAARTPDTVQLSKSVNNHVRNVVRSHLKRISDLGKEVQPYLIPLGSSSTTDGGLDTRAGLFGDEPFLSMQADLEDEAKWKESLHKRGHSAKRLLEEQLSLKLPLLAEDAKTKRRRLDTAEGEEKSDFDLLAALRGDPLHKPRLMTELARGHALSLTAMHQGSFFTGVTATHGGIFRARLILQYRANSTASCHSQRSTSESALTFREPEKEKNEEGQGEGCLIVENVLIGGIDEEMPMDDTASSCFLSEHSVFQAMTANALLASKYFAQRQRRQSAAAVAPVQELLWWLESFSTVFTEPCRGCKRLLYNDSEHFLFLPPTWRTLDERIAYHPQCLATFPDL